MLSPGACRGAALHPGRRQSAAPAVICEKIYYKLYERLSAELATQPQEAPNLKSIDSTSIDICGKPPFGGSMLFKVKNGENAN